MASEPLQRLLKLSLLGQNGYKYLSSTDSTKLWVLGVSSVVD